VIFLRSLNNQLNNFLHVPLLTPGDIKFSEGIIHAIERRKRDSSPLDIHPSGAMPPPKIRQILTRKHAQ